MRTGPGNVLIRTTRELVHSVLPFLGRRFPLAPTAEHNLVNPVNRKA